MRTLFLALFLAVFGVRAEIVPLSGSSPQRLFVGELSNPVHLQVLDGFRFATRDRATFAYTVDGISREVEITRQSFD